jgi:hypothetical protein
MLDGCVEALVDYEISRTSGYGRYFGYLRDDRGCHHCPKKYLNFNLVPQTNYAAGPAYAHLASGLCCGFSSLVLFNIFRLLGYRLE